VITDQRIVLLHWEWEGDEIDAYFKGPIPVPIFFTIPHDHCLGYSDFKGSVMPGICMHSFHSFW